MKEEMGDEGMSLLVLRCGPVRYLGRRWSGNRVAGRGEREEAAPSKVRKELQAGAEALGGPPGAERMEPCFSSSSRTGWRMEPGVQIVVFMEDIPGGSNS